MLLILTSYGIILPFVVEINNRNGIFAGITNRNNNCIFSYSLFSVLDVYVNIIRAAQFICFNLQSTVTEAAFYNLKDPKKFNIRGFPQF